MFFTKVAQSSQHGVGYFSQIFLCYFPGFLDDQIQAATVHVLHADVYFSVTVMLRFSSLQIRKHPGSTPKSPVESPVEADNERRVTFVQYSQLRDDLFLYSRFNLQLASCRESLLW